MNEPTTDPFTDDPVGRLFKAASDAVDARLAANPPRQARRRRARSAKPRPVIVDEFRPPADACYCAVTAYPPCSYCESEAQS